VTYGPLINKQGVEKVLFNNELVLNDNDAEVLARGGSVDLDGGNYLSPFVYKSEWRDAHYLKNEVFGPHVAIIPFDDTEDAVRIYNDTEYGLAVGILTDDFRKARYCRDNCDFGMCYWNGGSIAAESHLSFGGVKKSGNGFPSAARTFRAVTHEVSWTVNHAGSLEFPQGMK
jgi:aldehyde dehydrogenase (NAD+)